MPDPAPLTIESLQAELASLRERVAVLEGRLARDEHVIDGVVLNSIPRPVPGEPS